MLFSTILYLFFKIGSIHRFPQTLKSAKMEQEEEEEAERERNSVDSRLIASLKKIVPSERKMTSQKRRRTTRRFYSFPRKPERRRLSDESKHTWQGALNRGSAQMCFYQQVPILRRRNRQADRSVLFPSTHPSPPLCVSPAQAKIEKCHSPFG